MRYTRKRACMHTHTSADMTHTHTHERGRYHVKSDCITSTSKRQVIFSDVHAQGATVCRRRQRRESNTCQRKRAIYGAYLCRRHCDALVCAPVVAVCLCRYRLRPRQKNRLFLRMTTGRAALAARPHTHTHTQACIHTHAHTKGRKK